MNAVVKTIFDRVERWPEEDQEELAQLALEIELRRMGSHKASDQELAAIDEALAAVARGEIASGAEIDVLPAQTMWAK
jgi:hypothetical protein